MPVVRSRVGEVTIPIEVDRGHRRGVVSIPHGWEHDRPGARLCVAFRNAGVNSNLLADDHLIDELSGTAVLNGIPGDDHRRRVRHRAPTFQFLPPWSEAKRR